MIYALVIQTQASDDSLNLSALHFARAILTAKHTIHRVFFYGDGVYIANKNRVPAQDEPSIYEMWREFIENNNIDAVVCIAAGLKRGLLDQTESERYAKPAIAIDKPFTLSGLGQLIDACAYADRVITFK